MGGGRGGCDKCITVYARINVWETTAIALNKNGNGSNRPRLKVKAKAQPSGLWYHPPSDHLVASVALLHFFLQK